MPKASGALWRGGAECSRLEAFQGGQEPRMPLARSIPWRESGVPRARGAPWRGEAECLGLEAFQEGRSRECLRLEAFPGGGSGRSAWGQRRSKIPLESL